jgi:hypothetical protein
MLLFQLFQTGHFTAFDQGVVLECKNRDATRQQINIVKALFEDNLRCMSSVSLIMRVDNNELICLVLELIELAKHRVLLYADGWEVNCIYYVPLLVLLRLSQI